MADDRPIHLPIALPIANATVMFMRTNTNPLLVVSAAAELGYLGFV
ncbi:MAG: hypothetical protein KDB50_10055 [Mycobacterium sp.]|nr:hypothetical protein [Mycobacterium sp.]